MHSSKVKRKINKLNCIHGKTSVYRFLLMFTLSKATEHLLFISEALILVAWVIRDVHEINATCGVTWSQANSNKEAKTIIFSRYKRDVLWHKLAQQILTFNNFKTTTIPTPQSQISWRRWYESSLISLIMILVHLSVYILLTGATTRNIIKWILGFFCG